MNLEQKFQDLEGKLLVQHSEIALKLDAILTALGAPPPTATTTLSDVVFVLNAIHADTISLDQKLLGIRNAIYNPTEGLPPGAHNSIAWNMYRVSAGIGKYMNPNGTFVDGIDILSTLSPFVQYISKAIGFSMASGNQDTAESVLYYLSQLFLTIGVPGGLSIEEYVAQIAAQMPNLLAATIANRPTLALSPAQQCTAPFVSQNIAVVPYTILQSFGIENSRDVIAPVWPTILPAGIHYGSANIFGIISDTILESDNGWANYQVYVESSAPYWNNGAIGSIRRFQTNKWVNVSDVMTSIQSLLILVDGENTMIAYLCPDGTWGGGGGGGGDLGATYQSQLVSTSVGYTSNLIVWTGANGAGSGDGTTITAPVPIWFTPTRRYSAVATKNCVQFNGNFSVNHNANETWFLDVSSPYTAISSPEPFAVTISAAS